MGIEVSVVQGASACGVRDNRSENWTCVTTRTPEKAVEAVAKVVEEVRLEALPLIRAERNVQAVLDP